MKKVLLVDTNYSASPIYDYLVAADFEVFVCGAKSDDFLAKTVRNFINIDYSDVDKMRALIRDMGISYIVPGCNDQSYRVCSELNTDGQFAGMDNPEVVETINNKEKFRTFALKVGLPVPCVFASSDEITTWPVIVKPVDAFSGRGMMVVHEHNKEIFPSAIEYAKQYSGSKTCIIEQFLDGQLYSHSAFLVDGKVQIDFIVEEYGTANPFVVDTSYVIHDFSADVLRDIRENICLMAQELKLVDGLIHTQFILQGSNFYFIEITRRCPGDMYSRLIESSTNFQYADAYTRGFLNQKILPGKFTYQAGHILRHTVSQKEESFFKSLEFNCALQIEQLAFLSLAGDKVKASPFGRIALLFVRTESQEALDLLLEKALSRKLYTISHSLELSRVPGFQNE